jgi:pimeloyl-ACP methyl ester carboxylesterase
MKTLSFTGWAQAPLPWGECVDYLSLPSQQALHTRMQSLHANHVIGWSLGGVVALQMLLAGVFTADRLTLLGVPYSFIASESCPDATSAADYVAFCNRFAQNPHATLRQFHKQLSHTPKEAPPAPIMTPHLDYWLAQLGQLPLFPEDAHWRTLPLMTFVHGKNDKVVPIQQLKYWEKKLPTARVVEIEAGHWIALSVIDAL